MKTLTEELKAIGFKSDESENHLLKQFGSVMVSVITNYTSGGENVCWVQFRMNAVYSSNNPLSDEYIKSIDELYCALIDFCIESGRSKENGRIAKVLGIDMN